MSRHGVILCLFLAGLLGGCRTAIDPIAIQDAQVAAQIKTALVNDPELGATVIEVSVAQGVARLAGTVRTPAHVEKAVALARSVQGVSDVQSSLQVGVSDVPQPADGASPRQSLSTIEVFELNDDPRLFAVGVSFGRSRPRVNTLGTDISIGPLMRFGSGRGFGPALALNWFTTTLAGESPGQDVVSRIRIRPVMGGISYTFASDRISVSPSIVGGVAFNSLHVPETGAASRIAVGVDHSLIWGPGVSAWFDMNRYMALNVSVGYVVTQLPVTFLDNGRLVERDMRGDTAIVHAGLAYKLF